MSFPPTDPALDVLSAFDAVAADVPVSVPLQRTLESFQHDFPVVAEGRLVGMLSREAMLRALAADGPEVPVAQVMKPEPRFLHPNDNLDEAFLLVMQEGQPLPVIDGRGALVGLVTSDSVGELLLVRTALQERRSRTGLGDARERVLGR